MKYKNIVNIYLLINLFNLTESSKKRFAICFLIFTDILGYDSFCLKYFNSFVIVILINLTFGLKQYLKFCLQRKQYQLFLLYRFFLLTNYYSWFQ